MFLKTIRVVACAVVMGLTGFSVQAEEDVQVLKQEMQAMQEQFDQMRQKYNGMMQTMQQKIDRLERDQTDLASRPVSFETAPAANARNAFLPDVSFIGDVVYHATNETGGELDNDFSFRELEIVASGNIDTWARGDLYVAIENEDGKTEIALEEGYLTLLETPVDNLQAKFGKFRPAFGKANRMHLHNMPWVDYPKVIQNFFGEEGFSEAGASASYLLPLPGELFSEITVEGFNNTDSLVMGGGETSETAFLGHWKNFVDLSETATIELGGSLMGGENGNESGSRTYVSGADLTWKWEPQTHKKWTAQTEALFSNKERAGESDLNHWGMYASLEHQFAQRWATFGRFDLTETPDSSDETQGYSLGLKFIQSEYAFWRLQYTHSDLEAADDAHEVWLQLNFGLGPHRAHVY